MQKKLALGLGEPEYFVLSLFAVSLSAVREGLAIGRGHRRAEVMLRGPYVGDNWGKLGCVDADRA